VKRVLLLMTSTTYKAAAFLSAAERLGVEAVVGSDMRQALAPLNPTGHVTLPFGDLVTATACIVNFARRRRLDAVIACDDDGAVLAAHAAGALGLAANTPDAVRVAQNKLLTRETMSRAGLDVPRYWRFTTDDPGARVAAAVEYPCVIKPLTLSGSRGVMRANDPAQLKRAHARLVAILGAKPGAHVPILVETFIPGHEVAVEGLLQAGRLRVLAVFDKPDALDGPYFEETLLVQPSRHAPDVVQAIVSMTERAIAAIGLEHGPIHAELRCIGTRAVLLEVAPRSIGGRCARALRFGDGSGSLEELVLRAALGMPTDLEPVAGASGVLMIPIPKAGILSGVHGVELARAVPDVEAVEITIPSGQQVAPPPEGARYLGFVFARAAHPDGVETGLRQAHAQLDVDIAG
jgi:biotin carboxylase